LSKLRTELPDRVIGEVLNISLSDEGLQTMLQEYCTQNHADFAMGVRLVSGDEKSELVLDLVGKDLSKQSKLYYGGPRGDSPLWASTTALGLLRRFFLDLGKEQ
jgi:hypothetical protein